MLIMSRSEIELSLICAWLVQVAAFRNGFRTVVPFDWLSLFSGPEVQRLISGDNTPIDLKVSLIDDMCEKFGYQCL
jgi:hypothetical protein